MIFAIIGGGASGMIAAISCAETHPKDSILLFERQARVGRKLLSTGNGRCNLSNETINMASYHGDNRSFIEYAIETIHPLDWFHARGLFTVAAENGRIYPLSDAANSVLDVLRFSLEQPNLKQMLGIEVLSVKKDGSGFSVRTATESVFADKVIVACGGLAGTKLGGGMSGYRILRSLGHSCSKLFPALVQLKTEDTFVKPLKGVRADAFVRLQGTQQLASATGEVQFTEYGVSGPAIFEVSRAASVSKEPVLLVFDFLRQYDSAFLLRVLQKKCHSFPALECGELLTGMVHNRLGKMLLKAAQLSSERLCSSLTEDDLQRVVTACKNQVIPVLGTMGMDCAQVTAGGIFTTEFDPQTLQSRKCPGLYACGEVLDIDGDCGGYNLHWAWVSGILAGQLKEDSI